MARASQTTKVRGRTKIKTTKGATKTKTKGGKRGNPNRCPACGRFI